ncbi:MAG: hypothetical protein CL776_00680 [Chloroflexi bacterium]|nr:hypothetical protein [Chloroflexota bacterium]
MTTKQSINISQPLDLEQTLESGQAFRWRRADGNKWAGVIDGNIWVLSKKENVIEIESSADPVGGLVNSFQSYFRLDDDLLSIQKEIGTDEFVSAGISKNPGLRILRQNPWETLLAFILSSTSNVPRIARTMELLATELGNPLELNEIKRNSFPGPDALIRAGEQHLRNLKCGFRAPYMISAAKYVESGIIDLESLCDVSYTKSLDTLKKIPGVAEKIADCVMLFSLEHLEAFPIDRWIRRALTNWYGFDEKASYQLCAEWARSKFHGFSGYANQYIYWDIRQSERPMIGSGSTKALTPK